MDQYLQFSGNIHLPSFKRASPKGYPGKNYMTHPLGETPLLQGLPIRAVQYVPHLVGRMERLVLGKTTSLTIPIIKIVNIPSL
jgi:hypothetical protein